MAINGLKNYTVSYFMTLLHGSSHLKAFSSSTSTVTTLAGSPCGFVGREWHNENHKWSFARMKLLGTTEKCIFDSDV